MSQRKAYFDEKVTDDTVTYEFWKPVIFFHPMGDGLRLSHQGVKALTKLDTAHVVDSVSADRERPSKHYIFLARFCRKPYFIGKSKIIFFDEEEAFLFKLCDGDIDNVQEVAPERLDD